MKRRWHGKGMRREAALEGRGREERENERAGRKVS